MKFQIQHGNALDADEEALCINIDCAGPGMEGNVARQLAFRRPLLWQEIVGEISYPLPPGSEFEFVVPDEYADYAFRLIVLASTLHYEQLIDHSERNAVVKTAVSNTLQVLPRYGLRSFAVSRLCILRGSLSGKRYDRLRLLQGARLCRHSIPSCVIIRRVR